ncbi:MAG: hypothetical protein OEL84_09080 [Nitrosopumilus sp.]|nr:hypothetical protein [Nitrosopumilus sp.]
MEIRQAGEILIATNVIIHYIRKTARANRLIASAMRLTKRHGHRKKCSSQRVDSS